MSSILKALQRLQGDRGDAAPQPALGDDLARELAKGPPAPEEGAGPLSTARLALIGVSAAGLLLAMAGFGWWLARGLGPDAAPLAAESAPVPVASAEPPPEPAPPSGTIRPARPARPSASPEEAPTLPATLAPAGEAPAAAGTSPAAPPAAAPVTGSTPIAPAPPAGPSEVPAAPAEAAAAPAPVAGPAGPRAAPVPLREETPRIELVEDAPARAPPAPAMGAPAAAPPVAAAPRAEPRSVPAAPVVEVLRTTWHPHPERRVARIRVGGFAAPVEVREGDAVSTLVVKTIEPSGVLFLHGGEELRRGIGKP